MAAVGEALMTAVNSTVDDTFCRCLCLCCTQALYRLRAVVSRHTSTLSGGHSSAVVYENGSWMLYDESQVRKILALLQLFHRLPSSLATNIVSVP